jgi:small subunit ribosomal protein S2
MAEKVKKTAKVVSAKKDVAKTVKPAAKKMVVKIAPKLIVKKSITKKIVKPVKKVVTKKETVITKTLATQKVVESQESLKAKAEIKTPKTEIKPTTSNSKVPEFDLQEMFELGCHFGHKASKWYPKMAEYIYCEKDGIHLFDLPKVVVLLKEIYVYVYNLAKEGKTLLLVGTKKQARDVIKEAAMDASCFYINARWMGGLLTNWPQVSKSIKRMEEIREGLVTDKYKGYTKYERVQLEKEQFKLERFFGGLRGLKTKPDCIFVVDPKKERIVVAEANNVNVPVIALIDSDSDPRPVKYVLPGNDDAVKSIKFFVDQIAAAYKAGRADRK